MTGAPEGKRLIIKLQFRPNIRKESKVRICRIRLNIRKESKVRICRIRLLWMVGILKNVGRMKL